jgi:hypothetical protein
MITSAPYPTASRAPATLPTCAHCLIPAAFSFSTQRASGFVQYQTTKSTFSSMRTSTCPSLIDQVTLRLGRSAASSYPGELSVVLKNGK